jgi:hypothetical protein
MRARRRGAPAVVPVFENIVPDDRRSELNDIADRFAAVDRDQTYGDDEVHQITNSIHEQHDMEFVGHGQSRVTVGLPESFADRDGNFVVKFSLTPAKDHYWEDGHEQTRTEIERYRRLPSYLKRHVAPIQDADSDWRWIVMPYCRPVSAYTFPEHLERYFGEHGWCLDVGITENVGWYTDDDVTRLVAIDYGR